MAKLTGCQSEASPDTSSATRLRAKRGNNEAVTSIWRSQPHRIASLFTWLAISAVMAAVAVAQLACGRSDVEASCIGYQYTVTHTVEPNKLLAILNPGGSQDEIPFVVPSIFVNAETHQVLQDAADDRYEDVESRLRAILADATRELCRRALEDAAEAEAEEFDFRTVPNNCESYTPVNISYHAKLADPDEFDDPGPPIVLNPVCHARCLLDDCSAYETGGDYDDPPNHPFARTVRCKCQLEAIDDCSSSAEGEAPSTLLNSITDDFCVPEDVLAPAEYCRVSVADYFNAGVRAINNYGGVVPVGGYTGSCGDYTPAQYDLVVECRPIVAQDKDIETHADEAYSEQNDGCAPGCSDLSCDDLQNENLQDRPCTFEGPAECTPENCTIDAACDCDILPSPCFESDVVEGVCLPEVVGGADGGSDDGGGSPERLRSAINLLSGSWIGADEVACSELEPGGTWIPTEIIPPPTSAHSPYALTNGTSFTTGLHHTCPAPSTDDVELSTFATTLEELCRLIPLCSFSNDLSLTITATEDTTLLASGTLTKTGASISTTEDGAPLSVGDHTLELCVEHDPTEFVACSAQSIRASAPLGSGVDGHGYFAGELAADFVPIASKPGATKLWSLTDDGYLRVFLPSGFSFPFYGSTVSDYLWVGANGGINTTNRTVGPSNTGLPASSGANPPEIAVYWDDLDPSSGGGVYTWFDGMRFIVSWEDVPHGRDSGGSTTNGVSVQAHIYESGRIELHYLDTDVGDSSYDHGESATLGIGNLAGTYAVEVSHDDDTLLTSDVSAVGFSLSSNGCLADGLIIPPQVACAASDHYLTVCTPTGDTVVLPMPDVSQCAIGAAYVVGEVIESGSTEGSLSTLSTPIPIDENGELELDEGVHRVRWWPVDAEDEQTGPAFTQLVFARTWVHSDCSSSSQSMLMFTEGDDTYVAATQTSSLVLLGLPGDDVLVSSQGDDFIGDGPGAGICEANEGNDQLVGEDGDDTLDGGAGDDLVWGGTGDDLLLGGAGNDALYGQDGNDILLGGDDDDVLWGGLGDDVLEGDDGNDTLYPGSGVDAVYGGSGDDTIVILHACELTSGMLLSGGSGTDTLVLPPGLTAQDLATAGVTVSGDIESITTSSDLPTHKASCEPS